MSLYCFPNIFSQNPTILFGIPRIIEQMLLELIYQEVFGEEESILYLSRILEFVSLSQEVV
jgi:hypothetical protein